MRDAAGSTLDEQRLRRLLDVGRGLVAELELDALLDRVLEVARELTGARYAALGILDERRRELERFLTVGVDASTRAAIGDLPRGRGVLGVLIDDPRPLRLADVALHARSYGFPPGHPPMTTFLGVPIVVRGEPYGNLYLTDKHGGEFTEADEEAVLVLADWAAIAIDNARAYRREHARRAELEQAVRGLEATTAIARAVGGETDLDRVLELIVERARALVDARGVTILLLDRDERLVVSAAAGRLDAALLGEAIPLEGSFTGDVLRTGRPARLTDPASRLRFALERVDAQSGLFVPLVFRGRSLGVLAAFDRRGDQAFTREDERLLESFAASAATAVATAQDVAEQGLRRSIEASERERRYWARELHDETLQELAGLKVLLGPARRSDDLAAVRRTIDAAVEQIETSITSLRHLITELRPAALDQFGVEPALEALVRHAGAVSGVDVALDVRLRHDDGEPPSRLAPAVEDAVYRLVQESVSNALKHARAEHVRVAVHEADGEVRVAVADDGCGFDLAARSDGFGLVGMRERVALAGGELEVESAPGAGTTVHARLPALHPDDAPRYAPGLRTSTSPWSSA